jgi:hypothetical protein
MMTEVGQPRPKSFYVLGFFFLLFLAFLYGPMLVIFILSFQGPNGGMSFPMVGHSTLWFQQLLSGTGRIGDIPSAFIRSLETASLAAMLTVAICVSAGMAFRRRFPGSGLLFYTAVSSLVMPSLFIGFGIALGFKEPETSSKNSEQDGRQEGRLCADFKSRFSPREAPRCSRAKCAGDRWSARPDGHSHGAASPRPRIRYAMARWIALGDAFLAIVDVSGGDDRAFGAVK